MYNMNFNNPASEDTGADPYMVSGQPPYPAGGPASSDALINQAAQAAAGGGSTGHVLPMDPGGGGYAAAGQSGGGYVAAGQPGLPPGLMQLQSAMSGVHLGEHLPPGVVPYNVAYNMMGQAAPMAGEPSGPTYGWVLSSMGQPVMGVQQQQQVLQMSQAAPTRTIFVTG